MSFITLAASQLAWLTLVYIQLLSALTFVLSHSLYYYFIAQRQPLNCVTSYGIIIFGLLFLAM